MSLLSSPKVRLALIVNGLYFISFFTPTTTQGTRPRLFSRARESRDVLNRDTLVVSPKKAPVFPSLPPPSGPSKAATYTMGSSDHLDVYLTNDLTLVNRPDFRLLLSPTFTTTASAPEAPGTVLLRFISYSYQPTPAGSILVRITADGKLLWSEYSRYGGNIQSNPDDYLGHSVERIETAAVNLPYDIFFETIRARQVVLQFGSDAVELTPVQIEALRDMHRRVAPESRDVLPSGRGSKVSSGKDVSPVGVVADPVLVKAPPPPRPGKR